MHGWAGSTTEWRFEHPGRRAGHVRGLQPAPLSERVLPGASRGLDLASRGAGQLAWVAKEERSWAAVPASARRHPTKRRAPAWLVLIRARPQAGTRQPG